MLISWRFWKIGVVLIRLEYHGVESEYHLCYPWKRFYGRPARGAILYNFKGMVDLLSTLTSPGSQSIHLLKRGPLPLYPKDGTAKVLLAHSFSLRYNIQHVKTRGLKKDIDYWLRTDHYRPGL